MVAMTMAKASEAAAPYTSTRSARGKMTHSKTIRRLCTRVHLPADRDLDRMRILQPHRPWTGKEQNWPRSRILLAKLLHSRPYELIMSFVILTNVCLTIWETDYKARCYPQYLESLEACPFDAEKIVWLKIVNIVLLSLYTVEAISRIYVERKRYLRNKWNRIDAFVTATGWLSEILGILTSLAFIRIARCVRLLRAFRILISRELYLLLNGIMSSLRAIFYGTILLTVMLVGHSVILVEWVHPYNSQIVYSTCVECTDGFRSVWFSVLTLFKQLVAGDAWIMSFPLMESHWWIAVLMIIIIMSVTLGVMNLILTVIVERATDAREADVQAKARHKAAKQFETKKKLLTMCAEMDEDGSGMVSLNELLAAYDTSDEFRNFMTLVGIQRDDLEATFNLLDVDASGDLDYEEFCEELMQLESDDHRLSMAMLRYSVSDMRNFVENHMQLLLVDIRESLRDQEPLMRLLEQKVDTLLIQKGGVQEDTVSTETLKQAQTIQPADVASIDIDIAVRCSDLHQEMQSLALLQADVLREIEGQVSTLLCQAEQAASVGEALRPDDKSDHCNGRVRDLKLALADEQCSELHSLVTEMQRHFREQMSDTIHQMQHKVRLAGDTLDSSGNLLLAIQEIVPKTLDKSRPLSPLSFALAFKSAPISRM